MSPACVPYVRLYGLCPLLPRPTLCSTFHVQPAHAPTGTTTSPFRFVYMTFGRFSPCWKGVVVGVVLWLPLWLWELRCWVMILCPPCEVCDTWWCFFLWGVGGVPLHAPLSWCRCCRGFLCRNLFFRCGVTLSQIIVCENGSAGEAWLLRGCMCTWHLSQLVLAPDTGEAAPCALVAATCCCCSLRF